MNGIDQIIQAIEQEAETRIAAINAEADERIGAIREENRLALLKQKEELTQLNDKHAASETERLESLANLEARQIVGTAKEKAVQDAYTIVLERLKALSADEIAALGGDPETVVRLARERTLTAAAAILFAEAEEKK